MEAERNVVHHNGKVVYQLNEALAKIQGVTDQEMINLVDLHQYKLSVFDHMEATDDRTELRRLAAVVEEIEFEMQMNWRFPRDKTFHEWYKVPKCMCPAMDNAERWGTEMQVINASCPVHGYYEPR